MHRLVSREFDEDKLEVIRGVYGTRAGMCVRVSNETR